MMFDDEFFRCVTPFDGMGFDDAEEWLAGERVRSRESGVGSEPETRSPKPDLGSLLDAHIARLWHALPAQSQRRLGCVAVSTGVAVSPEAHAELLGALGLIAEAEGTIEQEAEFCELYLSTPWVCAAIAEVEGAAARPGKKAALEHRREQTRLAVQRHREKARAEELEKLSKAELARNARLEQTAKRRAIAIDGEGVSLEDGSHLYRYMAASLSDGTVLGELYDEAGISSADALGFVSRLPKVDDDGEPFLGVFGYGLGYDITKWLERLTNKPLYELFHSEDLKPKARCGKLRLLLIGKCLELVDVGAPKGARRTKVWDILKGFQSTFVKALMAWKVGTAEEWQRIEDMKKQRGNFAHVTWDRVTDYCKDECRLLAVLVETYIRAHVEAGIDLAGKYHGAGSTSDAFLMMMGALDKRSTREFAANDFSSYSASASAFSRAFFGGRAEVSRLGMVKGPVWTADIASAYPYVLYELPCVKHGKWYHVTGRGLRRSLLACKVGVVHYRVPLDSAHDDHEFVPPERPEVKPLGEPTRGGKLVERKKTKKKRKLKEDDESELTELERSVHERATLTNILADVATPAWGPLPYRTAKGSIVFPVSHPGGWAWKPEFLAAEPFFRVEPLEAWVLKGKCQCERPYRAIGAYYLLRIEWGSDGKGKVLKLGYNGCYGKFAQVVGQNPKYSCRVVAGHITASTRARLYEAICSAKDWWNVIYAATDGLIATELLTPPNPPENETAKTTRKWLGVWEVERHDEDLFLVQPGFYFSLAKGGKARTRGTPLEIVYEYRDKIVEQWKKEPTKKPRGLPKQSTFHGVKSSIRPPTKDDPKYRRDRLYGRWTSENRRINYVVSPKRSALEDRGDGSYRLRTWWMRPEQPESAEYKKDPSIADRQAVNDEQPDFVEPFVRGVGDEG